MPQAPVLHTPPHGDGLGRLAVIVKVFSIWSWLPCQPHPFIPYPCLHVPAALSINTRLLTLHMWDAASHVWQTPTYSPKPIAPGKLFLVSHLSHLKKQSTGSSVGPLYLHLFIRCNLALCRPISAYIRVFPLVCLIHVSSPGPQHNAWKQIVRLYCPAFAGSITVIAKSSGQSADVVMPSPFPPRNNDRGALQHHPAENRTRPLSRQPGVTSAPGSPDAQH